jgi:hypothetical protein
MQRYAALYANNSLGASLGATRWTKRHAYSPFLLVMENGGAQSVRSAADCSSRGQFGNNLRTRFKMIEARRREEDRAPAEQSAPASADAPCKGDCTARSGNNAMVIWNGF